MSEEKIKYEKEKFESECRQRRKDLCSTIILQTVDTLANFCANMGFAADMTSKAKESEAD